MTRRLPVLLALLFTGCASSVRAVQERAVHDEFALLDWRPATAAGLTGHWRVRSIRGSAAAVLMDLGYWIDADGHFSGAALFAGASPSYAVLSGTWTLSATGALQLGDEAAPARAEVARGWLRLSGAEGSLVFEHVELR
jgi:hypothetical protein